MSATAFAHSWRTLEDCETELNEAWSDLPAEYQDELRPDEIHWNQVQRLPPWRRQDGSRERARWTALGHLIFNQDPQQTRLTHYTFKEIPNIMKLILTSLIALSSAFIGCSQAPAQTDAKLTDVEFFEQARVNSIELYLKFYVAQTFVEQTEVVYRLLEDRLAHTLQPDSTQNDGQRAVNNALSATLPKLREDARIAYQKWIKTIPNNTSIMVPVGG
jgi:hypothetical protein